MEDDMCLSTMQRDMDLIRQILLDLTKQPNSTLWQPEIPGYSPGAVSYHIKLLKQAGFIEAQSEAYNGIEIWYARSITWNGHEFLDNARNETLWNRAKSIIADKGGSISFGVLESLLTDLVSNNVGL